jgi:hypothetical protein
MPWATRSCDGGPGNAGSLRPALDTQHWQLRLKGPGCICRGMKQPMQKATEGCAERIKEPLESFAGREGWRAAPALGRGATVAPRWDAGVTVLAVWVGLRQALLRLALPRSALPGMLGVRLGGSLRTHPTPPCAPRAQGAPTRCASPASPVYGSSAAAPRPPARDAPLPCARPSLPQPPR